MKPTTALDVIIRRKSEFIKWYPKETEQVSSNHHDLVAETDRVAVMYADNLWKSSSVEEPFTNPKTSLYTFITTNESHKRDQKAEELHVIQAEQCHHYQNYHVKVPLRTTYSMDAAIAHEEIQHFMKLTKTTQRCTCYKYRFGRGGSIPSGFVTIEDLKSTIRFRWASLTE